MPPISHGTLRTITIVAALLGQIMLDSSPKLAVLICGIALIAALVDGWWYLQPLGMMWWYPALWALLGLTMWKEPRGWFFMGWAAIILGTGLRAQAIVRRYEEEEARESAEEQARAQRMAAFGYGDDTAAARQDGEAATARQGEPPEAEELMPLPPLPPIPLWRYPVAVGLAIAAAWAGAWLTRIFLTMTGWQLDLLAVAVGYLVGKSVTIGAGDRSNKFLRVTATLLSIAGVLYGQYLQIRYLNFELLHLPPDPPAILLRIVAELFHVWLLIYVAAGAWAGWHFSSQPRPTGPDIAREAARPTDPPRLHTSSVQVEELLPYALLPQHRILTRHGFVRLKRVPVGLLVLPTGRLVAGDPFVSPGTEPFTREVPTGEHPVFVSVAELPNEDQRVAFACVGFRPGVPTRWELALTPDRDPAALKPGEIAGYAVDSGTGSFMDEATARVYLELANADADSLDPFIDEMQATYVHTWSHLNTPVDDETGGNLVAFSSGWGDGTYASYFGYDDEGLCCIVTDFGVLSPDPSATPD